MVAPRKTRKIVCTIVRVPVSEEALPSRISRPSDLLPWADPYIARLVHNLQDEVRHEQAASGNRWNAISPLQGDLEPPSPCPEPDWEWKDEPRWTYSDEHHTDFIE